MSGLANRFESRAIAAAGMFILAGMAAIAPASAPPGDFGLRPADQGDVEVARLLGVLTYTRLSLQFDDVPARDAFAAIASTLRINVAGRWNDDQRADSIDPNLRVTLAADGKPARDVIEDLLEQCEDYEDCTWQIRAGFVEIGSKRRLAAPAARVQRTYDLTDLLIEPPTFGKINEGATARCDSQYVDAVLGERSRAALRAGTIITRKDKSEIMLELVEGIIETIEPGRWDLGGDRDAREDDAAAPLGSNASASPSATAKRNTRHWASMRVFREALIITAPDFMHRQIGGYPAPIKPLDADTVRLVPSPSAETGKSTRADSADPARVP